MVAAAELKPPGSPAARTGGPKGKNYLFLPHLTAHGWEFGRNSTERINQNFYGTEGNLKNFMAYKEPI